MVGYISTSLTYYLNIQYSIVTIYTQRIYRSGTEKDYTELHQLLEDITTFRIDMEVLKAKEKQAKSKIDDEKKKGSDMRRAALEGMSSMLINDNQI